MRIGSINSILSACELDILGSVLSVAADLQILLG